MYLLQAYFISKQKKWLSSILCVVRKGINTLFKRQLMAQFVCYFVHITFESAGISHLNGVTTFLFISDH